MKLGLKIKLIGFTALVYAGLVGVLGWQVHGRTSEILRQQEVVRGQTITANLAKNAVVGLLASEPDRLTLGLLAQSSVDPHPPDPLPTGLKGYTVAMKRAFYSKAALEGAANRGLVEVSIVQAASNSVVGHSDRVRAGLLYDLPQFLASAEGGPPVYRGPDGSLLYHFSALILPRDALTPLGTVYVGMRSDLADVGVRAMTVVVVLASGLLLMVGAVVIILVLSKLTSPFKELAVGVKAIGGGDFTHIVRIDRGDELGLLAVRLNEMSKALKEKQDIENAFTRYVSAHVVKEYMEDSPQASGAGQRIQATVFFADIRGLWAAAGRSNPQQFIDTMNDFHSVMTEIIQRNGGTIDKFVREEVMAVWGLGGHDDETPRQAARAAVACLEVVKSLTEYGMFETAGKFEVAIGLNTGPVVAGNIGGDERMDYTVIGDTVNLAARFMSLAPDGGILVTQSVASALGPEFTCKDFGLMQVKGKKEPVPAIQLLAVNEPPATRNPNHG